MVMHFLSTFNADEIFGACGIATRFELWCLVAVCPIEGEGSRVVVANLVLNAAVAYKLLDYLIT